MMQGTCHEEVARKVHGTHLTLHSDSAKLLAGFIQDTPILFVDTLVDAVCQIRQRPLNALCCLSQRFIPAQGRSIHSSTCIIPLITPAFDLGYTSSLTVLSLCCQLLLV